MSNAASRGAAQLALLALLGATVQPRRKAKETREIYEIVEMLRAAGHAVYRAGAAHFMVDGERLPLASCRIVADAQRRRMQGAIGAAPLSAPARRAR